MCYSVDPMSTFYVFEDPISSSKPAFKGDVSFDASFYGEEPISPKKLLAKAHQLNDRQILATNLIIISSLVFGILALMFPYGSLAYGLYQTLSLSTGIAGMLLFMPDVLETIDVFRNATVTIPLAEEFCF